jgi:4'-phosphopantetheinyl transferase
VIVITELRVVHASLEVSDEELARCRALLDDEERARADRFRFAKHARRFTVARAFLRTTLGDALGRPAQSIDLEVSEQGKPFLPHDELHFNLSHSHELAVIAIAETRVGADVEHVRPMPDATRLAERFFAPEEVIALRDCEDRDQAFFGIWTAKEAYLKALGEGIAVLPLSSFAVSIDGDAPSLLRADNDDPNRWHLSRAKVPDGYLCTVALDITA